MTTKEMIDLMASMGLDPDSLTIRYSRDDDTYLAIIASHGFPIDMGHKGYGQTPDEAIAFLARKVAHSVRMNAAAHRAALEREIAAMDKLLSLPVPEAGDILG
jgi:hypothetical protein